MKLKNIFIFFSITISNIVVSQTGLAYYNKQLVSDNGNSTNEYMKKAIKKLKTQEYELSFNKNYVLYKKVDALNVDDNAVVDAFTQSISGFAGEMYFDNKKNTVIHKNDFSGSTFLIYKNNVEWAMTRETLQFDNYLCYKATTTYFIENSDGKHKLNVVAWYAPEISLPYGPDGYGGLPGLILQLEDNGIVTTLKKIQYLDDGDIIINLPSKGKKVTEDEFNIIVKNRFENRKDN